eukprot:TRINITY_DN7204_c0_g3_i2.p1 TRINITY_DN7204_c0_g3~~TRINITY_DN7204_c0_g3_i2.p1  ORF type:complete len:677 (-),score=215.91 TRINITY_DN7204_c0_g3_i2:624-2654(-)
MFRRKFMNLFEICSVRFIFFFFQAEDGIRDAQESRGLGDVYKRQVRGWLCDHGNGADRLMSAVDLRRVEQMREELYLAQVAMLNRKRQYQDEKISSATTADDLEEERAKCNKAKEEAVSMSRAREAARVAVQQTSVLGTFLIRKREEDRQVMVGMLRWAKAAKKSEASMVASSSLPTRAVILRRAILRWMSDVSCRSVQRWMLNMSTFVAGEDAARVFSTSLVAELHQARGDRLQVLRLLLVAWTRRAERAVVIQLKRRTFANAEKTRIEKQQAAPVRAFDVARAAALAARETRLRNAHQRETERRLEGIDLRLRRERAEFQAAAEAWNKRMGERIMRFVGEKWRKSGCARVLGAWRIHLAQEKEENKTAAWHAKLEERSRGRVPVEDLRDSGRLLGDVQAQSSRPVEEKEEALGREGKDAQLAREKGEAEQELAAVSQELAGLKEAMVLAEEVHQHRMREVEMQNVALEDALEREQESHDAKQAELEALRGMLDEANRQSSKLSDENMELERAVAREGDRDAELEELGRQVDMVTELNREMHQERAEADARLYELERMCGVAPSHDVAKGTGGSAENRRLQQIQLLRREVDELRQREGQAGRGAAPELERLREQKTLLEAKLGERVPVEDLKDAKRLLVQVRAQNSRLAEEKEELREELKMAGNSSRLHVVTGTT